MDEFIQPEKLAQRSADEECVIVDCRFTLGQPDAGRQAYLEGHIPGARYADLEIDLSGSVVPRHTGRHPLPEKDQLTAVLRQLGIDNASQVVAYDSGAGQMAAARLWWLLKWAGHDAVAVLDGGITGWRRRGLPLASGVETGRAGDFEPHFRDHLVVTAAEVAASLDGGNLVLADSRSGDRYRGENESIDPVAGHIPGAVSLPFAGNLADSGASLPPETLQERFRPLARAGTEVAFYCGSGVTAAQNVLAWCAAGLGMARLYAGSWSEWITDPSRPVATGSNP